jgi:uncharacterized protein (DUF362 family)
VVVLRASGGLVAAVEIALATIGLADCVGRGSKVLVKPNLHGGEGHTSPEVMTAVCRWAADRGARRVLLGDGPYWGMRDCRPYFEAAGVYRACAESGAEPVFFHDYPYRLHHPQDPAVPRVLGVSRYLYEVDVVISLPVMKTHFHTGITIALKNLKGCLRPVDKRRLHERELVPALAVVNELVQPLVTVTLCDATIAYEGMGPASATPVPLGLLVASQDPVALDVVCCQLMGLDPARVRLVTATAARGVGVAAPEAIEVVGERVADHARRFERPEEALARQFPGLTISGERACSVCSQNLTLALQELQAAGKGPVARHILIGAGPDSEADLLVGDCALRGQPGADGPRGCPPAVEAIRDALHMGTHVQ